MINLVVSKKEVKLRVDLTTVEASTQEKRVNADTKDVVVEPDQGVFALNKVVVNAVTSEIDENIKPKNIIEGVEILGVQGSYNTKLNAEIQTVVSGTLVTNIKKIEKIDIASNATHMTGFFTNCTALEEMPILDTSKVSFMQNFCSNCTSLKEFPSLATKQITSIYRFFFNCKSLKTIRKMNLERAYMINEFLYGCEELENVEGFENLGKGFVAKQANYYCLDMSGSKKLTHESLINVINNLYDLNLSYNVENGGTLYAQTLLLGENKEKLTEEEIMLATVKGWNVA